MRGNGIEAPEIFAARKSQRNLNFRWFEVSSFRPLG
jgi:hypothetical protein